MGWYAAQLSNNKTNAGIASLRDAVGAMNVFYPIIDERPLIAGYGFFESESMTPAIASGLRRAKGIAALLPVGHELPLAIPDAQIARLQDGISSGEYSSTKEGCVKFKRNQKLMITSGPFEGHAGIFIQNDRGLVIVEIAFLGQAAKVRLKGHQVSPAN